ncbi:PaaI family thioesterase [Methanogenium sp. S4BF]|uniref:PaaI family thioesterase n=1 Tax=Methanogenium sp. S4BF TaxID=1789226 RepID=UPI002416B0E0|nr:PaaI family thioesterase [Methanogenium sp. S4BF]WFN33724.1 PaaI family thioesterase [Methanogenium sp. S4BF]
MSYLEEISLKGRDANPFFRMMGIDIVSYGEGQAVLTMDVRPDMMNGDGWLQGGVYTALADEAMALALFTVLKGSEITATISESTSFYRGVQDGTIVAEGTVIRKGRKVAFTKGVVRRPGETGEVLAESSASFAVIAQQ